MSRVTREILDDAKNAVRLDEPTSALTYIGEAEIGSLDSGAKWKIKRMQKTGTVTKIEWADSDDFPDNVWNDRASLTYG